MLTPCPSSERLAAYLDGNRDPEVVLHLNICPRCLAVYEEGCHFLLSAPEGEKASNVIRFRIQRKRVRGVELRRDFDQLSPKDQLRALAVDALNGMKDALVAMRKLKACLEELEKP